MNFTISGFKCFNQETSFDLNRLTLLTGANSGGKSSVIQALLLTKKASESNRSEISFFDAEYALDLGKYDDVVCRGSNGDMSFDLDGAQWGIKLDDVDLTGNKIKFRTEHFDVLKQKFSSDFLFLAADRTPPHYEYKYVKDDVDCCNCHGDNVGNVLDKHGGDDITFDRSFIGVKNKLQLLMNEWVDYIFPGVALVKKNTGDDSYKVKDHDLFVATNIGFGITYALPIIINGLLAKKDGWLVVENPEAHLHPKAQSNMGYFLACMAAAGVRVVAETHSEHIVNGVRRFALRQNSQLKPEDISIYFFKKNCGERDIEKISVEADGNLSDLPVDFFDQVRQDMYTIIQLGSQRS